jgi:branched-chain amino acid transport system substrate-binding protein
MRSALVLVAVATLTLAACGSKSTDSTSSSAAPAASGSAAASGTADASGSSSAAPAGGLTITPLKQITPEGADVPAAAATTPVDPAGSGSAKCASGTTIAMAGALTGPNAALGINILNGAQLAINQFNAANAGCQITLKQFDTEGDPQKATQVAPQITGDASVIALLGPAFSGETKATGAIFNQSGLISVTASATNPGLTTNGWTNFFRGLGNDNSQGGATANWLTGEKGYTKVCVVQDNTDYGVGLAEVVTETLGAAADGNCAVKVKTGDKDFSAGIQLIKGEEPEAVYYAGYYAEAAPFVQQLRDAGVTAEFVSGDGTNDPQFVEQAGEASKDAILTCPCGPAPDDFAATYETEFNIAPGVYSVDAYDLATIMVTGISEGKVTDRASMIEFFKTYDGQGVAKAYKWDSSGELAVANPWLYQVQ